MKKVSVICLAALAVLSSSAAALAADAAVSASALSTISYVALAAGLAIGIAAFGTGLAQGLSVFGATTGIARNPEAAGAIRLTMIIGLVLIESLCIYALVISFCLLFAFPYSDSLLSLIG
ncbi:MAG: ATP synthase F0 subunit C [Deltaproteobacteria bacterium]|nr:ATP synthase F0 subunit C [Deltaproteobacteria bacterium]